jgi:protein-tyrosine-phosphatase
MRTILFICVENAGRSQMAEAFFRKHTNNKLPVSSAGTKPILSVNPVVVEVMNEIGIDVKDNIPRSLTNEMLNDSIVVNMGCMDKESCPTLFVNDVLDWGIPDPKGKSIDEVRKIRDQIELKVIDLIRNLE